MVTFLRDVMIVVAVLATFIALAFYPAQESAPLTSKHAIPVGVPPAPVNPTSASVEAVVPKLEPRAPQ